MLYISVLNNALQWGPLTFAYERFHWPSAICLTASRWNSKRKLVAMVAGEFSSIIVEVSPIINLAVDDTDDSFTADDCTHFRQTRMQNVHVKLPTAVPWILDFLYPVHFVPFLSFCTTWNLTLFELVTAHHELARFWHSPPPHHTMLDSLAPPHALPSLFNAKVLRCFRYQFCLRTNWKVMKLLKLLN